MSGSSIGTIAGGIIGGVIGFFAGGNPGLGASLGMAIGGAIGGALDPPKGPNSQGPRLNDLTVQTSTYGAFITRVYATIALWGNIFYLENNQIKETSKKVKRGGKGMGGGNTSTKTYSYSATFALGLCEGPIDAIGRIWIGPKLFYDISSADVSVLIASIQNSIYFKIYKGAEDQLPDPRMQAFLGIANVPAYRGLAYIMFYDLPLEDYGNSLVAAQIKVEIIKKAVVAVLTPRLIDSIDVVGYPLKYYPRPGIMGGDGVLTFYGYDPWNPSDESALNISIAGVYLGPAFVTPANLLESQKSSNGLVTTAIGFLDDQKVWWPEYSSSWAIQNGVRKILPWGTLTNADTANVYGSGGDIADALTGESGRFIIGLACSSDGERILITTGNSARQSSGSANRYFILDTSLAILKSGSISDTSSNIWNLGNTTNPSPNGGTELSNDKNDGWSASTSAGNLLKTRYFYLDDSDVMQVSSPIESTITGLGYLATVYSNDFFYVFVRIDTVARLYRYTANETVPQNTALSEIVSAECLKSNLLTAADIDVTLLTSLVRGYRISQVGAIRGGLEQLQAAWPFDAIQHGYKIKFIPRGLTSIATIPDTLLDAREAGKEPGVQVMNSREMDAILPQKVSLKFFDVDREYDSGEQYAERINTDAVNSIPLEMSIVLTAQEAAQKAEVLLYMYWMERYDISFKLPPEYNYLEPADVITITSARATYIVRLVSIQYTADGRLECKARFNAVAVYTSLAVGEPGQSTGVTLSLSGASLYELLDIPLLQDVYDMPGFPVAMTGYLPGWPGGVLFSSDDSGQTWDEVQAFTRPGSTIGYASTTLAVHDGAVLDKSGALTVRLYQGALSSVTEAQMFAGQNFFAYGADARWEIIAAENCVLQGDGGYILTDFLRGQFGTEWAAGLHVAGDRIVHLSSDELAFLAMNSSAIGVSKTYRGITAGKTIDTDYDRLFSYLGVNKKPLSPVALTGSRHPTTNDWTLSWTRRSRFAGWNSFVDAPLGEASESYEIEIYSSATYLTLKRTLTAASQTVVYTSAQQVTDFGSNQATLYVKIFQLSAVVGRGYALTQAITR